MIISGFYRNHIDLSIAGGSREEVRAPQVHYGEITYFLTEHSSETEVERVEGYLSFTETYSEIISLL